MNKKMKKLLNARDELDERIKEVEKKKDELNTTLLYLNRQKEIFTKLIVGK